jgi:hypothetical protein
MKSIEFPEANVAVAKDQPQYNTLFARVDRQSPEGEMIICFELTDEEVTQIVRNKKLFYSQLTFGQLFQPMRIMTESPFEETTPVSGPPMYDNRVTAEEWDVSHYKSGQKDLEPLQILMTPCVNCGALWDQHFYTTRQCKL